MDGILVLTIGHSTRSLESFIGLLQMNKVSIAVDIRAIPRSRTNPQFNKDSLSTSLSRAQIDYQHFAALGGLRHPRDDSPNIAWENINFRGFADYMQSQEFEDGIATLIDLAGKSSIALMCAEALPWRCHRWLIADALLIRGVTVEHIISRTSRRNHTLTTFAHVADKRITYPTAQ